MVGVVVPLVVYRGGPEGLPVYCGGREGLVVYRGRYTMGRGWGGGRPPDARPDLYCGGSYGDGGPSGPAAGDGVGRMGPWGRANRQGEREITEKKNGVGENKTIND